MGVGYTPTVVLDVSKSTLSGTYKKEGVTGDGGGSFR